MSGSQASTGASSASSKEEKDKHSRNTFSNDERRAIRDYYFFSGQNVTQSETRQWFQKQYNREVSQPVVSRILSAKYRGLDNGQEIPSRFNMDQSGNLLTKQRPAPTATTATTTTTTTTTPATTTTSTTTTNGTMDFSQLETKLLEWHETVKNAGAAWRQYKDQAMQLTDPANRHKLSEEWLLGFFKRHNVVWAEKEEKAKEVKEVKKEKENREEKKDIPPKRLHSSQFYPINFNKISKKKSKRAVTPQEAKQALETLLEYERQNGTDQHVASFYSQRLEAVNDLLPRKV